jgi:hypothetical protein
MRVGQFVRGGRLQNEVRPLYSLVSIKVEYRLHWVAEYQEPASADACKPPYKGVLGETGILMLVEDDYRIATGCSPNNRFGATVQFVQFHGQFLKRDSI